MTDQPKSTFAKRVRAAKPRGKRYGIRDDVIPGLFLRVFPTGARSFALDRMTRGRRRFATLGSADAMTIPEARARRPRGGMARGHRGHPAAGAHRMPPQRSAQSALAERWSRCAEPRRLED